LQVLQLPKHYDFQSLRLTPAQTRARLEALGYTNIVAFQTRKSFASRPRGADQRAVQEVHGVLLLHPVVGLTKPGDVDHYTRCARTRALTAGYYDPDRILLSLLPLAMRMAGPREALLARAHPT